MWGSKGDEINRVGIPGKSQIVNKMHRTQDQSDAKVSDDDRSRHLFRMACKIKELDELKEIRTAHQRFNKVQK